TTSSRRPPRSGWIRWTGRSAGLLLRHAGPDAGQARHRRSRPTRAEEGGRLGYQAPAGHSGRAPREVAQVAELRGRGRRDAGRVRVLRNAETGARSDRRARSGGGREGRTQALLEGAAGVFHGARTRRRRARRPDHPWPDLRAQAEVRAVGIRAEDGRRAVALPRQHAHPRAVDEVRAAEAFQVAAETRAFLTERGVNLAGEQQ